MQFPVLIESLEGGRFRAQVGEPFHAAAEAENEERALGELARLIQQRLQGGARIGALTVTNGTVQTSLPSLPTDDAYQTDWVYRELTEAISENRRIEESAEP